MNYNEFARHVLENGDIRHSRLGMTSEVIGMGIRFPMGALFYRPGMQRKLGWVEGLQVLGGIFRPSDYKLAAPGLVWDYTIDAGYGPKLSDQLCVISEQLRSNPETRRAIAFIDNPGTLGEQNRPCVSTYQFILSDGKLHMIVGVRSWDLVSGFLYDTQVMGMVGLAMANVLRVESGDIIATAGTAHVYHQDTNKIDPEKERVRYMEFIHDFQSWEAIQNAAIDELIRFRQVPEEKFTPWFIKTVDKTKTEKGE